MDRKLFNWGMISYFLIANFSFRLCMNFWYLTDFDFSSFRLFMASVGTPAVMLIIGIVCYRKYRTMLAADPDNSKMIITSQAVQWIGGWITLAIIIKPFCFALFLSLRHFNGLTPASIVFFLFFMPFIVIAAVKIRKSFRGNTQLVPDYVRDLCLILLSIYLFFVNSSEILQQILTVTLSEFNIKWVSHQLIFIGLSIILFCLVYKEQKNDDKRYYIELSSQAFVTGGYIFLIHSLVDITNSTNPTLPAWILLVISVLSIKVGRELKNVEEKDQNR